MNKSTSKFVTTLTSDAQLIWKNLNGVINVFKPEGVSVKRLRHTIVGNLCRDLNKLNVREPRQMVDIQFKDDTYAVQVKPDLSDHQLVVGPRYQIQDVRCGISSFLGKRTSGVILFGINQGMTMATKIHMNQPIRVYHITGRLGQATESHFFDTKVIATTSCSAVNPDKMNGLLASMQATHQKKMFEMSGLDIQSQAAFDLASRGLIRPIDHKIPLVYGIKCIDLKKPYFTLEIHAINETEDYLGLLIHEIGINLRSSAHCTKIKCIRQGCFTQEDALLRRHWDLQNIIGNLELNRSLLQQHPEILRQTHAELVSK